MAGIRNGDLTLCVDVRIQFVHDHFPALIPVFLRETSDVVAFILFQRVLIVKVSHGHKKIIIIADFLLPFRIFQQELEKHLTSFIDMINTGDKYPQELWFDKLGDIVNYCILLYGLLEDDSMFSAPKKKTGVKLLEDAKK